MNSPVGCCYRKKRKNKTLLHEQRAALLPPTGAVLHAAQWPDGRSDGKMKDTLSLSSAAHHDTRKAASAPDDLHCGVT